MADRASAGVSASGRPEAGTTGSTSAVEAARAKVLAVANAAAVTLREDPSAISPHLAFGSALDDFAEAVAAAASGRGGPPAPAPRCSFRGFGVSQCEKPAGHADAHTFALPAAPPTPAAPTTTKQEAHDGSRS
ncbi:MAG TPA: hypothetical protein VFQ38_09060 [Longimicrobiales bacterium]|nr:hypothetical protein [Longimicrobiales bacterium]